MRRSDSGGGARLLRAAAALRPGAGPRPAHPPATGRAQLRKGGAGGMLLYIQRVGGECESVEVPPGAAVSDVAHIIAGRGDGDPGAMQFTYQGQALGRDVLLADAGVCAQATLSLRIAPALHWEAWGVRDTWQAHTADAVAVSADGLEARNLLLQGNAYAATEPAVPPGGSCQATFRCLYEPRHATSFGVAPAHVEVVSCGAMLWTLSISKPTFTVGTLLRVSVDQQAAPGSVRVRAEMRDPGSEEWQQCVGKGSASLQEKWREAGYSEHALPDGQGVRFVFYTYAKDQGWAIE